MAEIAIAAAFFATSMAMGQRNARKAEKQNRLAAESTARAQQEQKKQAEAAQRENQTRRNAMLETLYGRNRGTRSLLAGGAQAGIRPETLG